MNQLKVLQDEITEEKIIQEILRTLKEYQRMQDTTEKTTRKFIFDWNTVTNEYVDITGDNRICNWLRPIKFNILLAIIIEAMQSNIDDIIDNRNKILQIIQKSLKLKQEKFYESIETIQKILINFGKVKVCKDGRVIIINEI